MSSNTQVIKSNQTQVTQTGKQVLDLLRSTWGNRTVEREVVVKDKDGNPVWATRQMVIPSSNKRLNSEISTEVFYQFASLVRPEDRPQLEKIIKAGTFEVVKAIQVFKTAPAIVTNRKIVPRTFKECQALNAPSFATITKYKGEDKAAELVGLMVLQFSRKFGKRSDLDDYMIGELSADIVAQYHSLTIAELKMVLTEALKASKKVFNLDYQTVMELVADAYEEKMVQGAKQAHDEHIMLTSNEKTRRERTKGSPSSDGMTIEQQVKEIANMDKRFTKEEMRARQKAMVESGKESKKAI